MNICLYLSTEKYDPVSALIREKTACDWSHVGFYDRDAQMSFSAKCDGRGVAWRRIKPQEKILLLNAPGADAAFRLALTQEGKSYDMLDIVGIALASNLHLPEHFICSTLVLWAFQQSGNPLLNPTFIPLDHLTPRDVLLSLKVGE